MSLALNLQEKNGFDHPLNKDKKRNLVKRIRSYLFGMVNSSHKSSDCLNYAKENGITCSVCHHIVLIECHLWISVGIYRRLKTYFNQESSKWLKTHPGRAITHLQIGRLFNEAYRKAATVQNASNGFKRQIYGQ